jgi:hypothetical protein
VGFCGFGSIVDGSTFAGDKGVFAGDEDDGAT